MAKVEKGYKGHLARWIANILWGIKAPFSQMAMEVMSPLTLSTLRAVGGCVLFWTLSLFVKREHVPLRDVGVLALAAVFGISANQLMFIWGLSLTSPIDASIITTTIPILTMLAAALFLGEPITWKKVLGIALGASGAMLLIMSGHSASASGGGSSLWGNVLCLLSQASFVVYMTCFQKIVRKYSVVSVMKWMFLFASIYLLQISGSDVLATDFAVLTPSPWLEIALVVFGATFVGYLLITFAQQIMRPTTVSIYNYVQPIVASLVAVYMGMDRFGVVKVLSVVLVFVGVWFVTQSRSKESSVLKSAK